MAFATATDVSERLGRTLASTEATQADALCDSATALICEAIDTAEGDVSPVPDVLGVVCVEMAVRAMANPASATQTDEALGAYSYTVRFGDSTLYLTRTEELTVRRAVHGTQISATPSEE